MSLSSRWQVLGCAILLALAAGCGKKHDDFVMTPLNPADLPPVPSNLTVQVAANRVTLNWVVAPGSGVDEFRVYRAVEDDEPAFLGSAGPSARSFVDTQVIDGVTYTYAVTAFRDGLEGRPSAPIEATPSAYGLILEGGVSVTGGNTIRPGSRRIVVDLLAPDTTTRFQLSEDPTFAASEQQAFVRLNPRVEFTLSTGDGSKIVYAKYFGVNGEESETVAATIRLDTKAIILAITENSNGQTLRVGDMLHLTLRADAPGGTAIVSFGQITDLPLFDDGSEGDVVAADGVFEGDFLVPSGLDIVEAVVTGRLTDDVGNIAALGFSATKITIADPPSSVRFRRSFVEVLGNTVTLGWTLSLSSDLALYRLYRSAANDTDEITEDDLVVAEVPAGATREFTDTGLQAGASYKWGVAAVDQSGFASELDSITVTVGFNPVLSTPTLNPTIGNPTTQFTYGCTYSHGQNRAPALVLLVVDDNLVFVMAQVGGGSNWIGGEDFQLAINLPEGAHAYHFEAEDVDGARVRLPASLFFSGPNVLP